MRYMTAGESHGPELTAIIEGLPAGLPLSEEEINYELARRQTGYGRGGRMKIEKDPQNPARLQTMWGKGYRFVPGEEKDHA